MTDDPWKSIERPDMSGLVAARKVSEDHRWSYYWARNVDGAPMFILRHDQLIASMPPLPTLNGITIEHEVAPDGFNHLRYRLDDPALKDPFHRLALNIMEAGEAEEAPDSAVIASITRTWSWHHLLRGGADGILSSEAQKGLIGELRTLEDIVLEVYAPDVAVSAWMGPLRSPKDFELGKAAIESKARRGAANPYVAISSEHQLDQAGFDALYLHVTDLQASMTSDEGHTLTELAHRVALRVEANPAAALVYEERLAAAGFRWEDDYSEYRWVETGRWLFRIDDGFPRISTADVPVGARDVCYSINLHACDAWEVELASAATELVGSVT